jgi:hypothetical protein
MSVLQHFEEYQKARVKFVQAVAEAATRPQNIEVMNNAGVMQLLRPLLLDNVPSIQQTAALALGRLANYSEDLAEGIVGNEILPQLVYSLSDQNVSIKLLQCNDYVIIFFHTISILEILQESCCIRITCCC